MPDTGAPWNIPYVAGTDLVADWPTDSQTLAQAIADGLDVAGGVKQVVTATKDDTFTTTSTSYTTVTGLSVSITPSSASNKVLLIASVSAHLPASTSLIGFLSLFRGATNLAAAASPGSRIPAFASQIQPDGTFQGRNIYLYAPNILDSPATTSATTYTVQVKASTSGTVYINRGASDTDDNGHTRGFSSLTAIEVSV